MPPALSSLTTQDPLAPSNLLQEKRSSVKQELGITKPANDFGAKRPDHTHEGIDLPGNIGDSIESPDDAEVIFAGNQRGYGKVVYLKHKDGTTSRYGHLSAFQVEQGDLIKRGVPIGQVGTTGNAHGPHVHYERRDKQGLPIDPLLQDLFPTIGGKNYDPLAPDNLAKEAGISTTAEQQQQVGAEEDPLSPQALAKEIGQQQLKTPSISSTVKAADEEPLTPIKFEEAPAGDLDKSLGRLGQAARSIAQDTAMKGMKLPKNHPDLIGRSYTISVLSASFTNGQFNANPEQVSDAFLTQLGPGYKELGDKFKQETGHLLAVPTSTNAISNNGRFDVTIRPTQGAIDAINAYATGGLSGLHSALDLQYVARHNVAKAVAAELQHDKGFVNDAKTANARLALHTARYLQNLKDLGTAFTSNYQDPYTDPTAHAIRQAEAAIPKSSDTYLGSAYDIGESTAGMLARAGTIPIPFVGFPMQIGIENEDLGALEAAKSAAFVAPLMAAGPITSSIAKELTPVERYLMHTGLGAYSFGATTAIQGGGAKEIAEASLTGAAFGTLDIPKDLKVGDIVKHFKPSVDGKEVVATTADGRVVVSNDENKSGVSVVTPQEKSQQEKERLAELLGVATKDVDSTLAKIKQQAKSSVSTGTETVGEGGTKNAEEIRSDQGQVDQTGQVREASQNISSKDIQQPEKGRAKASNQREQVVTEAKVAPTEPEWINTAKLQDKVFTQDASGDWYSGTTTSGKPLKVSNKASIATLNRLITEGSPIAVNEPIETKTIEKGGDANVEASTTTARLESIEQKQKNNEAETVTTKGLLNTKATQQEQLPGVAPADVITDEQFLSDFYPRYGDVDIKSLSHDQTTSILAEATALHNQLGNEQVNKWYEEFQRRHPELSAESIATVMHSSMPDSWDYYRPTPDAVKVVRFGLPELQSGRAGELMAEQSREREQGVQKRLIGEPEGPVIDTTANIRDVERRKADRIKQSDWLDMSEAEQNAIRKQLYNEMGEPTHVEGVPIAKNELTTNDEIISRLQEYGYTNIKQTGQDTWEADTTEVSGAALKHYIKHEVITRDQLRQQGWLIRDEQGPIVLSDLLPEQQPEPITTEKFKLSTEDRQILRDAGHTESEINEAGPKMLTRAKSGYAFFQGKMQAITRDIANIVRYDYSRDMAAEREEMNRFIAARNEGKRQLNTVEATKLTRRGDTPSGHVDEFIRRSENRIKVLDEGIKSFERQADRYEASQAEPEPITTASQVEDIVRTHERLSSNPVRLTGFDSSSNARVKGYLAQLREATVKYNPDYTNIVDTAIDLYHQGDYRKSQNTSEIALTRLHDKIPSLAEADGSPVTIESLTKQREEAAKPKPNTKAQRLRDQFNELDQQNNDELFKSMLSTSTKRPLKKGEYWRDRALKFVESEERIQAKIDGEGSFGKRNKLVTQEDKVKAVDEINRIIDPNTFHSIEDIIKGASPLVKLGAYYIEGGAREFTEWAKQLASNFTPEQWSAIIPHLSDLYEAAKQHHNSMYGPTATKKVVALIRQAKPVREATEAAYTKERGIRIGKYSTTRESLGGGEEAAKTALGNLKGELPKQSFEPIRKELSQQETDSLYAMIGNSPIGKWEKVKADGALRNLLSPDVTIAPTRSELAVLQKVYGKEFVKAIQAARSWGQIAWEEFLGATNIPRTVLASFDLSAPFRQGLILSVAHPIYAKRAFVSMLKSWGDTTYADQVMQTIEASPLAKTREKAGLYLSHWGAIGDAASAKEEFYALTGKAEEVIHGIDSFLESKLSVGVKGYRIGYKGIAASERAYLVYLNKLRSDVFDNVVRSNPSYSKKDLEGIATFINYATGRGDLGKFNEAAPILNNFFFSPRFSVSRLQVWTSLASGTKASRRMAAKDLTTTVAAGLGVLALARLSGLQVGYDPRSSDFGKIQVGNTRIDIWGGMQQPARYVAQIIAGQRITVTGDKAGQVVPVGRMESLGRFARSKESPQFSFIHDTMLSDTRKNKATGEVQHTDFIGRPVTYGSALRERVVPLAWRDIYDAVQEDRRTNGSGLRGGLAGSLGIFGVGITTIPPKGVDYDPFLDFADWATRR